MEQRYAFVLRIWITESSMPTGQMDYTLRGTLQSAQSAEPIYFRSLRQLNDLIETALQPNEQPISSSID